MYAYVPMNLSANDKQTNKSQSKHFGNAANLCSLTCGWTLYKQTYAHMRKSTSASKH